MVAIIRSFTVQGGFFPDGLEIQNLLASAGATGSVPGSGRSPGEGNSNPL